MKMRTIPFGTYPVGTIIKPPTGAGLIQPFDVVMAVLTRDNFDFVMDLAEKYAKEHPEEFAPVFYSIKGLNKKINDDKLWEKMKKNK